MNPIFTNKGQSDSLPKILNRATAYAKGDKIICTGKGEIKPTISKKAITFQQLLLDSSAKERWLINTITFPPDLAKLAYAIQQGEVIAVSDGSFQDTYGTAALVIEGETSSVRLLGKVIAPGGPQDQSPY